MGGGISTNGDLGQMIACTMLIGEAMFQGLDPRYIRFPDMYRLYDFHVGKKRYRTAKPQGATIMLIGSDGVARVVEKKADDADAAPAIDAEPAIDENDADKYLVVNVADDRVVLDRAALFTPNADGWTPLHASCHTLNTVDAGKAILKAMLEMDRDQTMSVLGTKTTRGPGSFSAGFTPLHIACAYGIEALALKLIKAKSNVNTTNSVAWNPLHEACHRGFVSIAKELLRAGADPTAVCPEFALCPFAGQTPLGEAARQGHVDVVKLLLDHGVDKNAVNALHWTALHEAAYHNRSEIVRTLVVHGADVLVKTARGAIASQLTISMEIKTMLDDVGEAQAASPKKPPASTLQSTSSPPKEKTCVPVPAPDTDRRPDATPIAEPDNPGVKPKKKKKSSKAHKKPSDDEEVPIEFRCAITKKLLHDPLKSPYGHVFERKVVEKWFTNYGSRCPVTGEPLGLGQLVPDEALKTEIAAWLAPDSPKHHQNATESAKLDDAKAVEATHEEAKHDEDLYDF
ncbi:hypothetical protein SPRG_07815 [Saprolegnia parasitica CBS 223.65]|uniref:U-box domain-containing protein n=1 Tax=Saprolegnia parasitica (strain CBS 223.65) TaxID=695850 RepID=A0A067C8L3_SAPPC|nr:hypothetical protein SPRG_07815 [Saprolegnia parasitica CBS 223.65]KDO27104.1 hypothetical protein SPRG_07815 [Saprolegnia parasitica CBS 223.65]|eukprot:XP_012202197.1 hypothetical protein SPRG_07815 [Saprolegnia parasitica CBS 223.65]